MSRRRNRSLNFSETYDPGPSFALRTRSRSDSPVVKKLLDFADDFDSLERSTNPIALVVLAHLKTMQTAAEPLDRCRWKLRLLRPLHKRGLTADEVWKLFRMLD